MFHDGFKLRGHTRCAMFPDFIKRLSDRKNRLSPADGRTAAFDEAEPDEYVASYVACGWAHVSTVKNIHSSAAPDGGQDEITSGPAFSIPLVRAWRKH